MAPYIFGKRSSIHIIDIRETVKGLLRAKKFVTQIVTGGKDVLFVGTKRQARHYIRQYADRVNMPYVAERWLGGTLTNFQTIRSRLSRLDELEAAEADGTSLEYSKKMIASRTRELRKIRRNLDGIRKMNRLPGALVVIDVHRERNAVREAKKLGIPTVCLIDTDSDPDFADLPIPGNDDAMRAIDTVLGHMAEAIEEGLKGRAAAEAERAERESRERRRRADRASEKPAGEDGTQKDKAVGTGGGPPEAQADARGPRGNGQSEVDTATDSGAPAAQPGLTPAATTERESSP
jgi:small subunit ribosomal protein S2